MAPKTNKQTRNHKTKPVFHMPEEPRVALTSKHSQIHRLRQYQDSLSLSSLLCLFFVGLIHFQVEWLPATD